MNYSELDLIYEKHPEIKDLVKASADMLQAFYNAPVSTTSNKKLRQAANRLREVGPLVDNRGWMK